MKRLVALVPFCVALLGGCELPVPEYPAVPPPLAERVPAPPRSSVPLIWRPGHYDWDGAAYAWRPGEWVERAGHGTLWQDGYWERRGAIHVWVPPHWL